MFRPMKIHHQEVSCIIQALWYKVMHQCIRYYGETPVCIIYMMQ
jgi:hypothetical protein